jgi:hypothetical protein
MGLGEPTEAITEGQQVPVFAPQGRSTRRTAADLGQAE